MLFQASAIAEAPFETRPATRARPGRIDKAGRRFMSGIGWAC